MSSSTPSSSERGSAQPVSAQPVAAQPVVAELGRPETAEERADRKAEASRRRREAQTFLNLVIALVASLGVVLLVVLVVVRPDPAPREPIDYTAIAAAASLESGTPLAAPVLPKGWWANAATFTAKASDGVASWYAGFVTPRNEFVALRQGLDANPSWVSQQLAGRAATGTTEIDGVTWNVFDYRTTKDVGNLAYAMTTEGSPDARGVVSSFVLFGSAIDAEFETVASALTPTITGR